MATRERIEQDLTALAEALAALNLEFRSAYEGYLNALGQAVKQQLVLACYHICTQATPEAFLQLSFDKRQKLQQDVRLLGTGSREKLRWLVSEANVEEESAEAAESPASNDRMQPENYLLSITNSPESLARWQDSVERAIVNIIKQLSRDANRVLQQSGILPRQLPEPVLEAASQAEPSSEGVAGPPNILSLIVETDDSSESENLAEKAANIAMQVTAIKLRLSEIEFGDANTSAWRQQIRNLSVRLNSIGRDYQKKRRELAVVEAESAWRLTWFED